MRCPVCTSGRNTSACSNPARIFLRLAERGSFTGSWWRLKTRGLSCGTPWLGCTLPASLKAYPLGAPVENRKPNTQCHMCPMRMYRRPWELNKGKGRYCSRACRNRAHPLPNGNNLPPPKYGADNPAWKGGVTYKRNKGNYVGPRYVRCPLLFLPMARKDGYVMEHRLVMAQHLGRLLTRREVVHHQNHNTRDNRIENLELFVSNAEHKRAEGIRAAAQRVMV